MIVNAVVVVVVAVVRCAMPMIVSNRPPFHLTLPKIHTTTPNKKTHSHNPRCAVQTSWTARSRARGPRRCAAWRMCRPSR